MELKLTDEATKGLVGEALLRAIDEDARNMLISSAMAYLLGPCKYNEKESVLQAEFNNAITVAARKKCDEMVAESAEVQEIIGGLIRDAIARVSVERRDKIIEKMAEKIGNALTGDRW